MCGSSVGRPWRLVASAAVCREIANGVRATAAGGVTSHIVSTCAGLAVGTYPRGGPLPALGGACATAVGQASTDLADPFDLRNLVLDPGDAAIRDARAARLLELRAG